ncbi:hypothetical protein Tco_0513289, partial [Tanacetum coccineum]
ADESSSMPFPEITFNSESECETQKPLPPMPKLIGVAPAAKKAPMIPKPFKECKYYGFNDHHYDNYEYYSRCEVCGSVAHKPADCLKKHPNSRKSRIANKRSTEPIKKYLKESSPKVVFGDDSSGDTEGYGSVNCNGITFTRVAYVNGLKHNLISISQLYDANFKVLFIKTQGTIFNQNYEVVLIAPRKRDVYIIDMASYNKESNTYFFSKASPRMNTQDTPRSFPDDEFFEPSSKVTQCPGNIEYFPYITVYKNTIPTDSPILQDSISSEELPEFTVADDHPSLIELDQPESVDNLKPAKIQDNVIMEPISDVQPTPILSPSAKGIL